MSYGEADDDLDAWMAGLDAALTRHFGPNHQEVLGASGRVLSAFDWRDPAALLPQRSPP